MVVAPVGSRNKCVHREVKLKVGLKELSQVKFGVKHRGQNQQLHTCVITNQQKQQIAETDTNTSDTGI